MPMVPVADLVKGVGLGEGGKPWPYAANFKAQKAESFCTTILI